VYFWRGDCSAGWKINVGQINFQFRRRPPPWMAIGAGRIFPYEKQDIFDGKPTARFRKWVSTFCRFRFHKPNSTKSGNQRLRYCWLSAVVLYFFGGRGQGDFSTLSYQRSFLNRTTPNLEYTVYKPITGAPEARFSLHIYRFVPNQNPSKMTGVEIRKSRPNFYFLSHFPAQSRKYGQNVRAIFPSST